MTIPGAKYAAKMPMLPQSFEGLGPEVAEHIKAIHEVIDEMYRWRPASMAGTGNGRPYLAIVTALTPAGYKYTCDIYQWINNDASNKADYRVAEEVVVFSQSDADAGVELLAVGDSLCCWIDIEGVYVGINAKGIPGVDGDPGAGVTIEYSVDGSGSWHGTYVAADYYMRVQIGTGGWSDAMKFIGDDGADANFNCS